MNGLKLYRKGNEEMLTKATPRLKWIDLTKFFAIYLMIVAHLGTWPVFDKWIHAFHMPIFFFVSGYWFDEKRVSGLKKVITKNQIIDNSLLFIW